MSEVSMALCNHQIESYIVHGDKDVPLLVLGGAGGGKSSIMAKTAAQVEASISSGTLPW